MAVTESKGNGYALYNGVKLPNIDAVWTDKEKYPYAVVINMYTPYVGEGEYVKGVLISNIPFTKEEDIVTAYGCSYVYIDSKAVADFFGGTIGEYLLAVDNEEITGGAEYCVWSSHDILNTDNSIYLATSDPIPLDGMNVIEWDGVTEGLEVVSDNYRLTDYREATNAIAVAKFDTLVMTIDKFDSLSTEKLEMWGLSLNDMKVILSTKYDFATVFPAGIWCMTLDDGNGNTGSIVIAYTPATTEPEEPEEPDTPTVEKFPLMQFIMGILSELNCTVKREPIAYLYNGVRLPKLPEWDRGVYPYAHLWRTGGFGYAVLRFSTSPICAYVWDTGNGLKYLESGSFLEYDMPNATAQWREYTSVEFDAGEKCGFDLYDNVWANTDIFYEDGTLYLAHSEPIPVYE